MIQLNHVVMPVRNGLNYTRQAVEDIYAQDIGNIHLWVTSNGSNDGSNYWLWNEQARRSTLHVTCHTEPRSVAQSWNDNLRFLFSTGVPHVLVVNNDVRLLTETYRSLVEAQLPFATAVGVGSEEQLRTPWTRADRNHPDFSCYLITRECWDRVGPFDEGYVGGYCEDADYHVRAHRKGVNLVCIGIPFLHFASGTIKANPSLAQDIGDRAHQNRQLFRSIYGCEPGTVEYEGLFTAESFGKG